MKPASMLLALLALVAQPASAMTLTSKDVAAGAAIASAQYYPRCGGQNVSPELSWSAPPPGAKSLVLTMIDQDVPPALWSHWIVVDLPVSARGLPGGIKSLPTPAHALVSDFGDAAYAGPCPPKGSGVHHYRFTVWAMPGATTTFPAGATAAQVMTQLQKTALTSASVTGLAQR